jgi:hypothetical protein
MGNGKWKYFNQEKKDTTDSPDFRNSSWGNSMSEVQNSEKLPIQSKSDDSLLYNSTIGGLDCIVVYIFIDDQLVRARYHITKAFTNPNKYIMEFERLKENLTKKYNNPLKDDHYWIDPLFQNDPNEWGNAISRGELAYFSTWDTKRTEIGLALTGENYEINLGIDYISKEHKTLEEKHEEKKFLDEL